MRAGASSIFAVISSARSHALEAEASFGAQGGGRHRCPKLKRLRAHRLARYRAANRVNARPVSLCDCAEILLIPAGLESRASQSLRAFMRDETIAIACRL